MKLIVDFRIVENAPKISLTNKFTEDLIRSTSL